MAKVHKESLKKEAKRLLEEKVSGMPLDSENRLKAIGDNIFAALKNKDVKIAHLIKAIDSEFAPQTQMRGLYEGFAAMSLDTVYALYLLNNNSALVLELQGLLERFCINALGDILPIDSISKGIITDILEKKTLKDVSPYMEKLGSWNAEDKEFAIELTKLRNGIAHKNTEIVSRSKLVQSNGQSRHYESIHSMMAEVDCTEMIVRTMSLIIKASGIARPSFIKQPRLYARYQCYTSIIGELHSLFLTNPYTRNNDLRLEVFINERLSPVYLIGSAFLVEKLEEYRKEILLFHKSMDNGEEDIARDSHAKLGYLLNDIREAMRHDLNVDFDGKELIEDIKVIDVKPYIKKSTP